MGYLDMEKMACSLTSRLQTHILDNKLYGAALYVHQIGQKSCWVTMGVSDPFCGTPISESTVFRIASMTKPITAVATMILVERGKIQLDDPVSRYLPQFKHMHLAEVDGEGLLQSGPLVEKEITLRHILSHTSGIGSGTIGALQIRNMSEANKRTLGDTISYFSEQGLSFVPYTKQEYSGFPAYDVLTGIVEKAADMDFAEFLSKEIFYPCDMTDTTFTPTQVQWNRMALMHDRIDGKNAIEKTFDGCVFEDIPCSHSLGGAGLVSTLTDYSHFALMLLQKGRYLDNRILKPESIQQIATPQVPASIQPGYHRWGLGVRVIVDDRYPYLPVGSYGWSGAYGPHFWIDPVNQIAAVYMKNSRYDPGAGSVTGYNFEEDVYNALIM